jgi:hypothetical protein
MEAVPELGDDEEVFTLDDTIFDGSCDAITGFFFVAIITGAIEKAVTSFDRVVDLVGARIIVDFPEPKSGVEINRISSKTEFIAYPTKGIWCPLFSFTVGEVIVVEVWISEINLKLLDVVFC